MNINCGLIVLLCCEIISQAGGSIFGSRCSERSDCGYTKGDCITGTCSCVIGLSYDFDRKKCVPRCDSYGNVFTKYQDSGIFGYNDIYYYTNKTKIQCLEKCREEILCVHIEYRPPAQCQLSKTLWVDCPTKSRSNGTSKGWDFYYRNCACRDVWFGENCDKQCKCRNSSEICDKVTGQCKSGCRPEFTGSDCQQESTRKPTKSPPSTTTFGLLAELTRRPTEGPPCPTTSGLLAGETYIDIKVITATSVGLITVVLAVALVVVCIKWRKEKALNRVRETYENTNRSVEMDHVYEMFEDKRL